MQRSRLAAATCLGLAVAASSHAATFVALTDDGSLHRFDSESKTVTYSVKPSGPDAALRGIDLRPADGKLYALGQDNALWSIELASGVATRVSTVSVPVPAGPVVVEFNPVADRMRILAAGGVSLRVNVETGAAMTDGSLKYGEAGGTPRVEAAAYSFSASGVKPAATKLYDLDLGMGALMLQDPPNEGVLKPIGKVALPKDSAPAFDIESDGTAANQGWLLAGGNLYRIDIATGAVAKDGAVKGIRGKVVDLAVIGR